MSELEKQFQPLLNECDRLRLLILQPEPGLATWHMLVRDRLVGMRAEMDKLLPPEPKSKALGEWKGGKS